MTCAVAVAERATSDLLSAPDWAINVELCNIIKADPRQGKKALKIIKKKLGDKNPKMQILALFVLDALSKSCGANIFHQMIERDILQDLVKIVKEKPDLNVREKIVAMIDSWQTALGGSRVKFPQYYDAYNELKSAGVEFPPMHPRSYSTDASGLSLEEIKTAERNADVLTEVLSALDPNNSQGVKDKTIVDLVARCRAYQKLVTVQVNNTVDESLLYGGLLLHDRLQRVLRMHDNIVSGTTPQVSVEVLEDSVARLSLFKNVDPSKLIHRSSKFTSRGLMRKPKTGPSKGPFSFLTRIYGPPEEMEESLIKLGLTSTDDPMVKNQLNGAGNLLPSSSRYNQAMISMYKYAINLYNAEAAEAKAKAMMSS